MPRPAAAAVAAADPGAPPALNGAADFGALLKALRRRWLSAAVLSLLLGAVAAGAAWYFMAPDYTSVAMLKVSSQEGVVWSENPESSAVQSGYLRTQIAALKSRRVILHALQNDDVKRLGLDSRYPDPVDWIGTQMKTDFVDPSEFITITFGAPDGTDANTVLKNIIQAYMDEVVYAEKTDKQGRLAEVEKIYIETSNMLKRKRENFKTDLEKVGGVFGATDHDVLSRQQQALLESLHDTKLQRGQLALKLAEAQSALKAIQIRAKPSRTSKSKTRRSRRELQADPVAKPQLDRLQALQDLIKSIQDKTSDARNPVLLDAQSRIADVQKTVDKRRGDLKDEMKAQLSATTTQDAQLNKAQLDNSVATLTETIANLDVAVKDMEGKADKIGVWNNDLEAQKGEIAQLEKALDDDRRQAGKADRRAGGAGRASRCGRMRTCKSGTSRSRRWRPRPPPSASRSWSAWRWPGWTCGSAAFARPARWRPAWASASSGPCRGRRTWSGGWSSRPTPSRTTIRRWNRSTRSGRSS